MTDRDTRGSIHHEGLTRGRQIGGRAEADVAPGASARRTAEPSGAVVCTGAPSDDPFLDTAYYCGLSMLIIRKF